MHELAVGPLLRPEERVEIGDEARIAWIELRARYLHEREDRQRGGADVDDVALADAGTRAAAEHRVVAEQARGSERG